MGGLALDGFGSPDVRVNRGPTLEIGLYLGVILLALALRLFHLGMEPLSPGESQRAYGAWQLLHGIGPASWREPLPALGATASLFLFGDSDFTVRLGSVFAGVGLVVSVWLLRPLIGRWASLAVALLIALSPSFVFFSRQVSPAAFAGLLSVLLVAIIFRYRSQPRSSFLYTAAIVWALLLNSGPMGITTTVVIILFTAAAYAFGQGGSVRRTILGHEEPAPLLPAAFFFVAVFLLVGTGLFVNLRGLGFPALRDWAIQFNLAPDARPWYYHGSLGLVYEPLVIFLAVMEMLRLFRKRSKGGVEPFSAFLMLWALVSFVLLLFTQEKRPEHLTSFILPVTFLAGIYLSGKLRALDVGLLPAQGPAIAYLAAMVVVTVLAVARYGAAIQTMPAYLWVGLAVAWLVALLLGFYVPGLFWAKGAGGGLLVLLVAALALTVHTVWNVSYRTSAGEALASPQGTVSVREVASAVRERVEVYPRQQVAVEVDRKLESPFGWYLRDIAGVHIVSTLGSSPILVMGDEVVGEGLASYTRFSGEVSRDWYPGSFDGWHLWRWLIYREPFGQVASRRVNLYVGEQ